MPAWHFLRVIGTQGGQGQRLECDSRALQQSVAAIAVDRHGLVWTVESGHPRRVAVWDATGQLVRQFIGSTTYGASHCALHEQDPTLGVACSNNSTVAIAGFT